MRSASGSTAPRSSSTVLVGRSGVTVFVSKIVAVRIVHFDPPRAEDGTREARLLLQSNHGNPVHGSVYGSASQRAGVERAVP